MKLAEVRRVRFDYRKACCKLVEVRRVRFAYCKALMKVVEVCRVCFDPKKCAGALLMLGESVLPATKLV